MLRGPSAGRKLRLPAHCARREVSSPDSVSVPAAYLKAHSQLWPALAQGEEGR